jgi:AcrR family transcriptional regulator
MKAEKKNPIKEKILTCAVKLLEKQGIKKLAQPQIAKDAGIAQGHITYYFPTRSDLLMAVAQRSMETIAKVIMKQAAKHKGPISPKTLVPLASTLLKDHVRTRTLLGLVVESDENDELKKSLNENLNITLSLVATTLGKENIDAEVILLHSTLMGLAMHDYVAPQTKGKIGIDEALELLSQNMKGEKA